MDKDTLYISYPISWALTAGVHAVCFFIMRGRLIKNVEKKI